MSQSKRPADAADLANLAARFVRSARATDNIDRSLRITPTLSERLNAYGAPGARVYVYGAPGARVHGKFVSNWKTVTHGGVTNSDRLRTMALILAHEATVRHEAESA